MDRRPHRVLIVDDHPIVREGLRALISQQPDLEVCGEAEGVATALELVETSEPDIAVIDISLKDGDGLELIRQIKQSHGSVRMLVSSMHEEGLYARRSLRAGALGYVSKENAARQIIDAIRRVLSGKIYLSDEISDQLLSRLLKPDDGPGYRSVDHGGCGCGVDRRRRPYEGCDEAGRDRVWCALFRGDASRCDRDCGCYRWAGACGLLRFGPIWLSRAGSPP